MTPSEELTPLQQLQKSANQGDPEAQWKLGICYEMGQGLPKDETLAVRYYRLSAAQGNIQAHHSLGKSF